ncbi:MAG: hypothetical protein AB7I30_11105 [Isosphaeraceae bacterium]
MFRIRASLAPSGLALPLFLALTFLATGCGQSGPVMGRVSGTVTYKGQPLTKGNVSFVSTEPSRPNASGAITSDGSFTLQTREPGDGAEVGEYKIAVTDIDPDSYNTALPGEAPKVPKSEIPAKYADANTSGLTHSVTTGSNTVTLELKDE